MKILVVLPRYQYADHSRGETHEYSAFLCAIKRSFSYVYYLDSSRYIKDASILDLNRDLLGLQHRHKFNLVFCVQWGNEFFADTLGVLRKGGATLINWATDDSYRFDNFTKYIARRYDFTITTEFEAVKKYQDIAANCIKGYWGFSEEWRMKPIRAEDCVYDVSFVGMNYFDRGKYMRYLQDHGIRTHVGGHGWRNDRPVIGQREIPTIYNRSKIVLNFSKSVGGRQTKARVFESLAAGSCLLTENSDDLGLYFNIGSELLTFETQTDCLEKIRMLLANPVLRDSIALRGHERCVRQYSYEAQFLKIFHECHLANRTVYLDSAVGLKGRDRVFVHPALVRLFRYILFSKFTPSLFRRVVRAFEKRYFPQRYLSPESFSIH